MMTASIPAVDPRDANDDSAAYLSALGKRVREGRERRGLSRKALSIEARVSERYLAQLEAGEGNVSIVLLRRVAAALGTTLPDLVGDGTPEHRLIRRFLEELPLHRLEDALVRLMREFGRDDASRRTRIALVGLRGAGKTTLGAALAREFHWPFVELDRDQIERACRDQVTHCIHAGLRHVSGAEQRVLDVADARLDQRLTVEGGVGGRGCGLRFGSHCSSR